MQREGRSWRTRRLFMPRELIMTISAGLYVAQQLRADYVERAGLGGSVVRAVAFAEDERLEAVGVARGDERVFKEHRYRV